MRIKSLELKNFHNQKDLLIEFSDSVTNIYGGNGVGKTTVLDALYFLLYQKDSKGRSDTSVRPYKLDGQPEHDVETSVKGMFEDNGYEFTLQIVHKEKWTKISGTDERKLSGNTNEFFISGIPKKQNEYKTFIQNYFMTPWFELTSNPNAFPNLPWTEQRKTLIDLVGNITVDDVLKAHPELEEIQSDLAVFEVDELKKKFEFDLKNYKKIVVEIPARIDELTKSLSDIADPQLQRKQAEVILFQAEKPLDELRAKRAAVINGTAANDLKNTIEVLENKMEVIRGIRREKVSKVKEPFSLKIEEINQKCISASEKLRILRPQMAKIEQQIIQAEGTKKTLMDTWKSIYAEEFNDNACPHCHRPYSEEMLQPMLDQFNLSKAARLEKCNAEGEEIAEKIKGLKNERTELLKQINELSSYEVEQAPNLKLEIMKQMQMAVEKVPPVEDFTHPETKEKFHALAETIKLRRSDLEEARLDINLQLQKIDKEIAEAKKPVDEANSILLRIKMDDDTRERIEQLKSQKNNALNLQGDAERKLNLLSCFIKFKVDLLNGNINRLFDKISFKLFEKNISNEGIKETCEILMHGVPYRQLSFAEKHIAGMEIIKVISDKMNIANPVFIDNRESISQLPEAPGQLINLIVSAEDRRLRVEHA